MIPGIAALLLVRGCPEDRLDEALALMGQWPQPISPRQAMLDADRVIELLPDAPIEASAT